MDAVSLITYVDPSLEGINIFDFDRNFDATYGAASGTLALNADLDQILHTSQTPITVSRVPLDRVWNAQDQEEHIKLLCRNCALSDFPFPPIVTPANHGQTGPDPTPPGNSCQPPPKRRGRKRKAQLTKAEKEEKRKKFLERNRLAASKCRAKKKNEQGYLQEKKRILEQENQVLKKTLCCLWDEVRLYREIITTHASCNHPGIVELIERNSEFAAATNALCQTLLGVKEGESFLDGEGSPRSSSDARYEPRYSRKIMSQDA